MFLLEKESGDVIALTTGGVETRITVIEAGNGRFILAIDAPEDTLLEEITPYRHARNNPIEALSAYNCQERLTS